MKKSRCHEIMLCKNVDHIINHYILHPERVLANLLPRVVFEKCLCGGGRRGEGRGGSPTCISINQ